MKSSSDLEAARSSWLASVLSNDWLRQLWRNPTISRKADGRRQFFLSTSHLSITPSSLDIIHF